MKKLLLLSMLVLALAVGCTSMEEERNALFNNAKSLEESGKYAEARSIAQKTLTLDPNFALGYILLGRCDMAEKNSDGAAAHFARALELAPDNLEAAENLSRIYLIKGDLAKAEEYVTKAAALSPSSVEVKVIKAGIFMRRNEYEQARPLLEEVLKARPADEEALIGLATIAINSGERGKARELLDGSLEKQPSPAVLSMLTNLAIEDNDLTAAEGYIKRLMEISEADEQLALHLANIYQATNRQKEAVDMLNQYLDKKPEALSVRTRLSEMSMAEGRFDEALAIVDKAPEKTPQIRLLRAGVLTQAGKVDEALNALRALSEDSATDKETAASAQIGIASIYLQQNKSEEAEKALTTLIERDPQNGQAFFMRAGIYFNDQEYDKARADMEQVVKIAPEDPAALLGLADIHNADGDAEEAEKIISDVIVRFPGYAQAYVTMANLHMMHNKPEAALMTLNIGKSAVKDNAELILAETDILINQKRFDDAQKQLESLAEKDSHKVTALLRLAEMDVSRNNLTAAAKTYERILKDNPDIQTAVDGYLQTLVSAKKPKEAMAFAEKRHAERPDDAVAAYLFAETALLNRESAKAEKAFLRALEIEPAWEQPLTRLSQVYASTSRLDEAIKLCDSILEKLPDSVSPAVLRGILLEQKGSLDEAEKQYRKVLEKHNDNLLASNNLAYLLSRHNNDPERLKEAEELAEKATASGAPATYDTLGWAQHLRGNNEDAEENVRRAIEEIEGNPTITYHLAAILAAQKDDEKRKEAVGLLEKLTADKAQPFPQMAEAKKLLQNLKKPAEAKKPAKKQPQKPTKKK